MAQIASTPALPNPLTQESSGFQREAASAIVAFRKPEAEARVRHKLQRWNLQGYPGPNARRVLRRLRELQSLVPPRVSAACFGTIWNRWTTSRRFQQRGSATNRCVLGCSISAEDSVEHNIHCHIVQEFAHAYLRLGKLEPHDFLLASADTRWNEGSQLTRLAILVYCTYRATQTARHQPRIGAPTGRELLQQMLKDAVRDHAASARVLRGIWAD